MSNESRKGITLAVVSRLTQIVRSLVAFTRAVKIVSLYIMFDTIGLISLRVSKTTNDISYNTVVSFDLE